MTITVTVDDLDLALSVLHDGVGPLVDAPGWEQPAGSLDWTCRRTLDHIADALVLYAINLARRATTALPLLRDGMPEAAVGDLLGAVDSAVALLQAVTRASSPGARAFHPAGMADASGFLAMACDEVLIHADDIVCGFGRDLTVPADLAARVLGRLFPWAPRDGDPWAALRWANGRAALPDRPRQGRDWYWHCAPLDEWDGTVTRRVVAPRW